MFVRFAVLPTCAWQEKKRVDDAVAAVEALKDQENRLAVLTKGKCDVCMENEKTCVPIYADKKDELYCKHAYCEPCISAWVVKCHEVHIHPTRRHRYKPNLPVHCPLCRRATKEPDHFFDFGEYVPGVMD